MLKDNVTAGNFAGVLHCRQLHRCSSLPTTPTEQGERELKKGGGRGELTGIVDGRGRGLHCHAWSRRGRGCKREWRRRHAENK
jgi:hypothetical protein